MSKKRYKQPEPPKTDADSRIVLPLDEEVGLYYRQSTDAQVGNVSTAMQTIDMEAYLQGLGWGRDKILLIDMDAGVSGTTKIDEREGMSTLFDLITQGKIRAVACQDEDRLFRDVTQIQVNIFIEACKQAKVLVITPTMMYDFAHPFLGTQHARQFRFKADMAAEYITTYLHGRLHPAKKRRMMEGRWAGGTAPPGFMIDERKNLPDGSENPNWRHYEPYPQLAEIVNEYFNLFLAKAGNVHATMMHILEFGPFFPDPKTWVAPDGYRFSPPLTMKNYGKGFCPGDTGLVSILSNAAYIGHWTVNDVIVRWNNHPAIVPLDTFMRAFNYLSEVTLDGKTNPNFVPHQTSARPSLDRKRPVERPLCSGLIYSKVGDKWRKAGTAYQSKCQHYAYAVYNPHPYDNILWWKKADYVDEAVTNLMRTKLVATFDEKLWLQTLEASAQAHDGERTRKTKQLEALERTMANLVTSLETLTSPTMIKQAEKRYQDAEAEHARLSSFIAQADTQVAQLEAISKLKEMGGPALENWPNLSRERKLAIVHSFISRIVVTPLEQKAIHLEVHWRDNTVDEICLANVVNGWLPDDETRLLEIVDSGASQVEICAAFPSRTWKSIGNKLKVARGARIALFDKKLIKDDETYEDFVKRVQEKGLPTKPYSAFWKAEEIVLLLSLVDRQATQVEIAAAFPLRKWANIRGKIRRLRRANIAIEGSGQTGKEAEIRPHETYDMYLMRKGGNKQPSETIALDMSFQDHHLTRLQNIIPARWKCCDSQLRTKLSRFRARKERSLFQQIFC
jgi:hypothetical protein